MNKPLKGKFINQVIERIQNKGFKNIKAIDAEYEDPKTFKNLNTGNTIMPDATATKNGRKHYFEVALKAKKVQRVVSKWKLLSTLAGTKNAKLHLYVPKGHKAFTNKLVMNYGINAKVIPLK